MRRKKSKKVISILCVISICLLNSEKVYAMEPLNEQIEEKLISSNAKEYEMNIVLEDIAIRRWHKAPYAFDEMDDGPIDEPLGEYSEEKLKEYTDEDFQAEFEYCIGYYGFAEDPHLIQIVRIYKDGQLYIMDYYIWTNYEINAVVIYSGCYFIDPDDFTTRMEGNENYDK